MQIHNFGGVNQLRGFLATFVKTPNFHSVRSVGIVRDAETSEQSAFQSIQSSLKNVDLPIPPGVGTPSTGEPRVTVMILPGGGNPGMLETVLCQTFNGQKINLCIDEFFECADKLPHVSIGNRHKARAYAYLATVPDSHHSVGVAAKAGVWNLAHSAFDDVRRFLSAL